MNTANLQIEGLLVATSALVKLMHDKGIATVDEVDWVLQTAEASAEADASRQGGLRAGNVEAILFPLRFLRIANRRSEAVAVFSEIAAEVGRQDARDGGSKIASSNREQG